MSLTPLQKRLQFQATRRSTREMEELLHVFVEKRLAALKDGECERVLMVLNWPDVQLYDWITGLQPPPPELDGEVLNWLRSPSMTMG